MKPIQKRPDVNRDSVREPSLPEGIRELAYVDADPPRIEPKVFGSLNRVLVSEVAAKRIQRVREVPTGALLLNVWPEDSDQTVTTNPRIVGAGKQSEQGESPRLAGGACYRRAVACNRECTECLEAEHERESEGTAAGK